MSIADRWLLPDGVEELLPQQARQVEALRRKLLDLYHSWGYDLVVPPLIEFTDSLLVGLGKDIDIQTFKVVDQLSGRTMAIRADITPQAARIDAHSLKREGPVRLCYAGSVLHTKPKSLLASRCPIQVGAELYGSADLSSDIEIICLMLETLNSAGVDNITLDLGHVGIYKALVKQAELNQDSEQRLFDALQRKSPTDIDATIDSCVNDTAIAGMLRALSHLNGDVSILAEAKLQLAAAPDDVLKAIESLQRVAALVSRRMPSINFYFDLSELRGYHYHTGLVFSALAPGHGQALANGGRYDHIGEVFGRARPATGFNTDLKALLAYSQVSEGNPSAILAPNSKGLSETDENSLWQLVSTLRQGGHRVVFDVGDSEQTYQRRLILRNGDWAVTE